MTRHGNTGKEGPSPTGRPNAPGGPVPPFAGAGSPGGVSPGILHAIEYPVLNRQRSQQLTIRGWCFDGGGTPLRGVRARIGSREFIGRRKQARPLIGRRYPGIPEAAQSGFLIEVRLPRGRAEVIVECKTGAGAWRELERLVLETPFFEWPWSRSFDGNDYEAWIAKFDRLTPADAARARREAAEMERTPRLSVLMPVYNTPEKWLKRALESVLGQWYPHWELCVVDDGSTASHVRAVLGEYGGKDARIRLVRRESNGHIVEASNTAMEMATGEYLVLLDHDDELRPHALLELAREIAAHPETDLVFSDEDHIDKSGKRYDPEFKPDFNYDLLLSQNAICHLAAYRAELVRRLGGFRPGTEGAQDWDLALRVVEASSPDRIRHLPKILYHWRSIEGSTALAADEKPYALEAGRAVVQAHLERTGQRFESVGLTPQGRVRVRWALPEPWPRVTIVIPTRNLAPLLRRCVDTLLAKTDYPDYDVLVVDNDSDEEESIRALGVLAKTPRVSVVPMPGPFNYSLLNNRAVERAASPVVCLLNNDIEILDGDWLREMVSQAVRPEIGAVGARLHYPDGRIQHAGVILGALGGAGHFCKLLAPQEKVVARHAMVARNYCAVTAACLVIERAKYLEVGGLDEETFAVAFNDVDFCLKLRAAGYRNLYTPYAELIHHESASRGGQDRTGEGFQRVMRETLALESRWHALMERDPCYNPNLTLAAEDGSLAFPPREPVSA